MSRSQTIFWDRTVMTRNELRNEILAEPRLTAGELRRLMTPEIPTFTFNRWIERGHVNFERQLFQKTGKESKEEYDHRLEEIRSSGQHRRYTGNDALKIMALGVASKSNTPPQYSGLIYEKLLYRVERLLIGGAAASKGVAIVHENGNYYTYDLAFEGNPKADWYLFVDIERLANRFLSESKRKIRLRRT